MLIYMYKIYFNIYKLYYMSIHIQGKKLILHILWDSGITEDALGEN